MQYRTLGHSGLRLSTVSLGSWLTYGAAVDDGSALACLHAAQAEGINFFDTADVYNRGGAERLIGKFLGEIRRRDVIVGTKAFGKMSDNWMDQGLSLRWLYTACQDSLERLQTDYIDLYQCHRYDDHTPLDETCYAMHTLIEKGWVRHWGVSQWSAVQIVNAVRTCERHGWRKPVSNQPIYNMLNRSLEVEVMEVCEAEGLGLVVYSPLAQGILSGKYAPGVTPPDSRAGAEATARWFAHKRLTDENFAKIDLLKGVAYQLGVTMPQLALAWCLRKAPVTSVITGASRPEQVRENVRAAEIVLPAETLAYIEEVLQNHPIDQYTGGFVGHGVPKTL